jgi:hypothetical protein
MKRTKSFRTLEELWELEERYPLVDASAGGLLRWLYATGMLQAASTDHRKPSRRNTGSSRRVKNGRS